MLFLQLSVDVNNAMFPFMRIQFVSDFSYHKLYVEAMFVNWLDFFSLVIILFAVRDTIQKFYIILDLSNFKP